MPLSIVITVKDDYELTRQAVESVWNNLDPTSYSKIIIADDYSDPNGKLTQYENEFLRKQPGVEVINFNEERHIHFYRERFFDEKTRDAFFDYTKYDRNKFSLGHRFITETGLQKVETDYAFTMDMDAMFLPKARGMLSEISRLFEQYPKVMLMGHINGKKSNEIFEVDRMDFPSETIPGAKSGGAINNSAGAVRMEAFTKYGLKLSACKREDMRANEKTGGALWSVFNISLFNSGLSVLNYPLFGDKKMFHLGNATIRKGAQNWCFGFCKDMPTKYGARYSIDHLLDWRAGRFYINMTNNEYKKVIKEKYEKPFDQIQPTFDEGLFFPVDGENFAPN